MRETVQQDQGARDQRKVLGDTPQLRLAEHVEDALVPVRVPDHGQEQRAEMVWPDGGRLEAQSLGGRESLDRVTDESRDHHLGRVEREALRQVLAEAEVEQADATVRQDEEVAGVGIAVKRAQLEDHGAVEPADLSSNLRELVARAPKIREAGHLDAFQELEDDRVLAAEVAMDRWNPNVGPVLEQLPHSHGRLGFANEVELELDEAGHLEYDAVHVDPLLQGAYESRGPAEHSQVEGDDSPDLRVLDLHGHVTAVEETRTMHLCEGGRGQRRRIEGRKDLTEFATQVSLDERPEAFEGPRWNRVMELAQLLDERWRKNVRASPSDLRGLRKGSFEGEREIADLGRRRGVCAIPSSLIGSAHRRLLAHHEPHIARKNAKQPEGDSRHAIDTEVLQALRHVGIMGPTARDRYYRRSVRVYQPTDGARRRERDKEERRKNEGRTKAEQGGCTMAEAAPTPVPNEAPEAGEEFDLFLPLRSAGTLDNPYPIYSLLRAVRPVLQIPVPDYEGPGVWLLTRYRDVHTVLRDPRFSADRLKAPLLRDNLERVPAFIRQSAVGLRTMLVMDPPDHTRVRKLVNKAFTPRRIAQLRGRIEQIVDDSLEEMARAGRTDLIHDLAEPLPAIVIAELLGVPAEDHRKFRAWSTRLIAAIGAATLEARQREASAAAESILGYLSDAIAARRREPRDDLISAMIHAQEASDVLSDEELLATCNLLLLAGHETTTNLIGNGMLALLREPDELARLRADPSLLPTAVEELLRFDGPVQATVRVALEDVDFGEHVIPAGSLVLISIGAANHDPEVFVDPNRLDVGRDPNPHLAFGFATHFCMGAPMARLEGQVAFASLIERFPKLSLVDEAPEYRPNPILRGLKSLELSF
jgi:pimeloyl-[acyl-carrier protein] synthase